MLWVSLGSSFFAIRAKTFNIKELWITYESKPQILFSYTKQRLLTSIKK
jgi:hypothetical protein